MKSKFLAGPYIAWMAIFTVVPLVMGGAILLAPPPPPGGPHRLTKNGVPPGRAHRARRRPQRHPDLHRFGRHGHRPQEGAVSGKIKRAAILPPSLYIDIKFNKVYFLFLRYSRGTKFADYHKWIYRLWRLV